ncbi:ABC transporter ATP-binding protein [Demetria terragena]|uniref:ABC transporter ATP-binding protein n=1 Tax=Demetria terragena TaxID=63959 RepID=UPI0003736C7B|nr:ABC transporter ATP-binding protein [Demetria terragena]
MPTTTDENATATDHPDENSGGALTLRSVRKDFGGVTALTAIDLEIRAGEFLSLLGPSGCGKTTLLRMIAGFEAPTSGSIELDGQDLTALPPYRRPVNTVFQSYALFPHMTVADNVAYGLKRSGVPRREIGAQVMEGLRLVRMESFADRKPAMLSGGQQQRVALARALVNRPRVLLLDEPMSALDRKLREEMQLELIRLHSELGLTFIFVTHDQEEALAMSDRIVVLEGGMVQQIGGAEDIYRAPANAFVAGFIGRQNFLDVTFDAVSGDMAQLRAEHGVLTVPAALVTDRAPGEKLRATVRPETIRVANAEGSQGVSSATDTSNEVVGTLMGESFLGDVVQYLVRLPNGQEVVARASAVAAPTVHEGRPVRLSWASEAVAVFNAVGASDD